MRSLRNIPWSRLLCARVVQSALFVLSSAFLLVRSLRGFEFTDALFLLPLTVVVLAYLPGLTFRLRSVAETVWFFVLAAYLTFALWGNYFIFIRAELTWEVIPCFIWSCGMARVLVRWMDGIADKPRQPGRGYAWLKWAILAALAAAPLLVYHEAFNPAVMSIDSNTHISQAIDAAPLSDWHSPLYTLCIRALLRIQPRIAFVVVVQIVLVSCAIATAAMLLHRQGMSFRALCVGVCVFTMLPNNGLQINTIWKDIPFSFLLVLLTYAILVLLERLRGAEGGIAMPCVQCGVALVGIYLFRQNGIAPFIGAGIVLITLSIRYRKWALLGTLIAAIAVVGVVKGPVYQNVLHIEHEEKSDDAKYYSLLHDLQGIYYEYGEFSEQDLALLERIVPDLEVHRADYQPTWFSDHFYDMEEVHMGEFFGLYLRTFVKNPLLTIRGVLLRCNAYWSILLRDHKVVNVTSFSDAYVQTELYFPEEIAQYGLKNRESFYWTEMNRINGVLTDPLAASVLWSMGIWVLALLLAVFHCIFRKKAALLWALLPTALNYLALLATSSWSDYRYGYPVFLIGVLFPLYALLYRAPGSPAQQPPL